MKAKEFFNIVIKKSYYDLTLDEKIAICKKHKAKWEGATVENGQTIILLSRG